MVAAVIAIVISVVGLVMASQDTSVLQGTGTIWAGVAVAAVGAAVALVLRTHMIVIAVCLVLTGIAVASAVDMQHKVDERRQQIENVFNN